MPAKKKEELIAENAAAETPVAEKPKRGRRKKTETDTAVKAAPAKKTTTRKTTAKKAAETEAPKKTVVRKPRKKAVVPNFVIQNKVDDGITYESVVEKVQAAVAAQEVTSLDIYVKAEEGKAYYVVNGEAAGAVDLF